ncbi:MAG: ABC-F family ATP-binding cassette domain-containing protein [Acidimicrobiales bacterium]
MLSARDATVHRGGQTVLDAVSLSVDAGSRIGVVGPNGVGKTTLLRVLAGLEVPDRGAVERAPASLRVGYLTQEPDAAPEETVRDYLARRTGVAQASADLDRLTAALSSTPAGGTVDAYSDALDRFLALGGDDFDTRVGTVAAGVGLPADRLGVAVSSLSGGQAARAGLAAVLLARFDVFLLDEPTNDLDFAGLDLLERFLKSLRGGVVIVSHDRAFLDRVVDRMVEIEEHHHTTAEYAGGWSEYVELRALARSHQAQAYEAWSVERARLRERIRTQRSWSEAGAARVKKKPRDHDKAQRDFFVNRTEKQASKVRQSERALERLGSVDKPWDGWELQLDLTPGSRSGDVVVRMEGAVLERGPFRLGPVDVEVAWADRVAITGPNGGGKSTLLAALLGRVPLTIGRRWLGPGVVVGELDQRREALGRSEDLLAGFVTATGLLPEAARSMLAKFGLSAGDVSRTSAELSPGERTRAQLAVLMATGTNCLVLDEPTNHLDLPAIEQLEAALARFEGTLLVVSHDRWLLGTLDVSRAWIVADGKVTEGPG